MHDRMRGTETSGLFARLPHSPLQHFALYFYGALLRVAAHARGHFGSEEVARERLPFLFEYLEELEVLGIRGDDSASASTRWRDEVELWEQAAPCRLPLVALRRAAALGHDDIVLLAQIGLPEEDPRFAHAFDVMQGGIGERRASPALLGAAWPVAARFDARASAHRLRALGLIEHAPGDSGGLRPCASVWDAIRGSGTVRTDDFTHYRPPADLPDLDALIISPVLRADCEKIPTVLASGDRKSVV